MSRPPMQRAVQWMRGMMLNHMPLMITCREFEDFILAYIEGELPAKQRRIFDLHLKVCRECRDYLAAYKRTMEVSRHAYDEPFAPVPESVPEDLVTAILEAKTSQDRSGPERPS